MMADPWAVVSRAPLPAQPQADPWAVRSVMPVAKPSTLDDFLGSPGTRIAKGALINPLIGTLKEGQGGNPLMDALAMLTSPAQNAFNAVSGTAQGIGNLVLGRAGDDQTPNNPITQAHAALTNAINSGADAINNRFTQARAATGRGTGTDWYQGAGELGSALLPMPGGKAHAATEAVGTTSRLLPDVAKLISENIAPTLGQTLGGSARRMEEAATSIPVLGDTIKAAQMRSLSDLNRAAYNRVLAHLQQTFPAMGAIGRKGIDYLKKTIGNAYDSAISGASINHDSTLAQDLSSAVSDVADFIPDKQHILQNFIDNRIQPLFKGGSISGDTFKQLDAKLRDLSSHFGSSPDPDNQILGEGYDNIRQALMNAAARTTPKAAEDIKAANTAFANYVRVSRAAGSQGAREGIFSPEQLNAAVRGADNSVRKDAFARGQALMQDLSDPAINVMGRTVPDSGTPLRWQLEHPIQAAGLNLAALPLRVLYSKPGQAAVLSLFHHAPAQVPFSLAPRAGILATSLNGQ